VDKIDLLLAGLVLALILAYLAVMEQPPTVFDVENAETSSEWARPPAPTPAFGSGWSLFVCEGDDCQQVLPGTVL